MLFCSLTTDLSDGCEPTWYSLPWRSKFYMECLQKFDIEGMVQRGKHANQRIMDIGHVLRDDEYATNLKNNQCWSSRSYWTIALRIRNWYEIGLCLSTNAYTVRKIISFFQFLPHSLRVHHFH